MITGSPHLYRREGLERGRSEELVARALADANKVEQRGCAAVLTLGHLAYQTGVPYKYLRAAITRSEDPYRVFEIRRRTGKTPRLISTPLPSLMNVQRWILDNILSSLPTHPSSYAYENGKSIRMCAERHLGARWLVKMDLHDFFHNITEKDVFDVFDRIGYSRLTSLELSRLCTRSASFLVSQDPSRYKVPGRVYSAIPDYQTSYLGFVPQGAPTSGAIANQVAMSLDYRLSMLADRDSCIYTRYADDLTFSSAGSFSRSDAINLIRRVTSIVESCGFIVHRKKTRIVTPGARKIVLGLLVDTDRVRLPREISSRIVTHIRGVEEFGLPNHRTHRGFSSSFGFIRHVEGLLAYAHDIEPEWAAKMADRWGDALETGGWKFPDLRKIGSD